MPEEENIGEDVKEPELAPPVDASSTEAAASEEGDNESPSASETPKDKPSPEDALKERLRKSDARRFKAERDARKQVKESQQLKERLEKLEARVSTSNTPQGEERSLTRADFDHDEDRFLDYRAEQAAERIVAKRDQERASLESSKQQEQRISDYHRKLSEYAASNPDYVKAVEEAGDPDYPQAVQDALLESSIPVEIDHHLMRHPELLTRLESLTTTQQIREIGRIEAQLEYQSQQKSSGKKPNISNAPEPPDVGTGGGPSISDRRYSQSISMAEFMEISNRKASAG